MIKKEDLKTIELVQGDTLTAYFKIPGLVEVPVEKMMFTCKALGINSELTRSVDDSGSSGESGDFSDTWLLWYENTQDFRIGSFTYDLTAVMSEEGKEIVTYIYNGTLTIIPKRKSPKSYNPYWEYPHNVEKEH